MTATLERPEDLLQQLPPAWRYAVGTPEDKAIFHEVIARLLAEEADGDGGVSLRIQNLLTAYAAQRCCVWIDDVRRVLRQVPDAEAIVAKSSEAKLTTARNKAETASEKAADDLDAAKRAVIVAEQALKTAEADLERFRDADRLLNDPPGHAGPAVEHLRRLRGA